MTPYFAYGSNLVTAQLKRRCPTFAVRPRLRGPAVLDGHRLVFPVFSGGDWGGGVAGIEPGGGGSVVHGVVYELDDAAMAALDVYEGVAEGLYRRAPVTVRLGDGAACACVTYLAAADPAGPFAPSRRYLDAIVAGAVEHGLPADYLAMLRRMPAGAD